MEKDLKIDNNTAVHCPTEALAKEVLAIADQLGYKWWEGDRYTDYTLWYTYRENTCYDLTEGLPSSFDFFLKEGYNIISAQDFINLHKK